SSAFDWNAGEGSAAPIKVNTAAAMIIERLLGRSLCTMRAGVPKNQRRRIATTAGCGGVPSRREGQLLPWGESEAENRVPYRSPGCWTERKSALSPGAKAGPV